MTPEECRLERKRALRRARSRRYRRRHPERVKAQWSKYSKENREKLVARNRAYKAKRRMENPKWSTEYHREWRARNPTYVRDYTRKARFMRIWLSWTRTMAANGLKLSGGRRRDRSLRSLL